MKCDNLEPAMNQDLMKTFENPGSIYRGAPFWAWNCRLDRDQLLRQIDCFEKMGLGGFHMHARTGLDTEYLSDEFMGMVKACCEYAKSKGMLAWLYDEDRWPSGAAGGLVTREERFRARHLLFTPSPYEAKGVAEAYGNSCAGANRCGNGTLLARYDVTLENGCLKSYRLLKEGEQAAGTCWYAYLETALPSSWFNNETYVDTLNPEAIARFVEVTHERYREAVGDDFGKTVPAIFTDEPQFVRKGAMAKAGDLNDVVMPWTPDFGDSFLALYGGDIMEHLPEIFWDLPQEQASVWRYRYHDHICERFTVAFADTVGNWCEKHGIALTGHMMAEPTLHSQTAALGEAMRSYRSFQIPGIDILCDGKDNEYSTAKQAQSAAHQYGRFGTLSELYGVTNWDFDFAGHKRQGDWQAALGVVHRVQHLSWVSMAGEAKRDYPASISYQSPWCREYPLVEDHFARVNSVLTRGCPAVRIGVVHPVESYWLCWGPQEQTQLERQERDADFTSLISWLLYDFADFDFISESLLPEQNSTVRNNGFAVGQMEYDVVVVPNMRTIRATTLARLEEFAARGGEVIFTGEIPTLVDAVPSDAPARLAAACQQVPFKKTQLLAALQPYVDVHLCDNNGVQVGGCLVQVRREDDALHLFVCNTDLKQARKDCTLKIRGTWTPTLLDTFSGNSSQLGAIYENGFTCLPCELPAHGSILLTLAPGTSAAAVQAIPEHCETARLDGPVPITLSEPNVLLLDSAEFRIGDGDWQPPRHLLKIDPLVRQVLGLPTVDGHMAQPWTDREPVSHVADLTLRFRFESDVAVETPALALENAAATTICLDGRKVSPKIDGYFVDESIQKVVLPRFEAGSHVLELTVAYTRKTYIEWCYLLGDFGVVVRGSQCRLVEPVRELHFGDWTTQGLPFYAGNLTYHCRLPETDGEVAVRIPHFKGALVKAALPDGQKEYPIAFAPYRAELGACLGGQPLDLTVFGNRYNAFGQLHHFSENTGHFWSGPGAWHTTGDAWADEYQLRPMGILSAPRIERRRG
jgi:hypothetical protein